jgi:SAM-dependent methyltransferase
LLGRRITVAANGDRPSPPVLGAPTRREDGSACQEGGTQEAVDAGPPGFDTWFADHYGDAANRLLGFLALDGHTIEGKRVADIGAGDGILDLGLVHKGRPAQLVGFDLHRTHEDILLEAARREGVCDALPEALEFEECQPASIPAPDGAFDVVVTWSAFEHIDDPLAVLREARRVIADDGILFLQLWPFYYSQFGSHLRDWFPKGWEHLQMTPEEIEVTVRSSPVHGEQWADVMLGEFGTLNKVTVDDLGRALRDAGFGVQRLNLLTRVVPIPPEPALRFPLSALGVEGIELTAVPLSR